MSYEGYEILLCENGHFECEDAHALNAKYAMNAAFCHCGALLQHVASVDTTNCLPLTLDFKLILKTPEVTETCHCCKHTSVKEEATYTFVKVPPYESEDGNFIFNESGSDSLVVTQINPEPQQIPVVGRSDQLARGTDWRDIVWGDSQT